eukprot:CAMPEP_0179903834 /NCGR_PEP_ID=MMETSP0982-20121206/41521_1 /TAXON_ID=483367 /ORGANISM="non described non described, Strain CCMP 2436" /LENGTH=67 /DNA_ID=CAMNT_0021803499 /DNA_START=98 /DNA_END=301 /DNA_ORIENTATION=-
MTLTKPKAIASSLSVASTNISGGSVPDSSAGRRAKLQPSGKLRRARGSGSSTSGGHTSSLVPDSSPE